MSKLMVSFSLAGVILLSSSIYSQQFSRMDQTVDIKDSGAAEIHVQLNFSTLDTLSFLQLACAFDEFNEISATLQPGEMIVPVVHFKTHEVPFLQMSKTIQPGDYTLQIEAQVDAFLDWDAAGPEEFGTYEWEMVYENNQPMSIDSSSLTVKLPEGWNFHRVLRSAPEFKKKDPKPPYTFSKVGDQASVTISRVPLHYRDQLGVEFTFKQEKRGSILIYVGLVIALLYLYFFRDLILKHRSKNKNKSDETSVEGS